MNRRYPTCQITVIPPFGNLHTFEIDAEDLMQNGELDPLSINVSRLKEFIIRQWRNGWGLRPANPSLVNVIFFGESLEDQVPFERLPFQLTTFKRNSYDWTLSTSLWYSEEFARLLMLWS
ncbi:hypothetical protein V2G26_016579 [Clonostachys chloroleuca]